MWRVTQCAPPSAVHARSSLWVLAFCPMAPNAAGSPPQMRHGAAVNGCCTTNEPTAKGNGGAGSAGQPVAMLEDQKRSPVKDEIEGSNSNTPIVRVKHRLITCFV